MRLGCPQLPVVRRANSNERNFVYLEEPATIPYRKHPNRKFCKFNKGEHKLEVVRIRTTRWGRERFICDLICGCGKKDYQFKNAETLSQKEKELLLVQALEGGTPL